ncbi:hypothetical protein YC2023_098829 [Brassica napus]
MTVPARPSAELELDWSSSADGRAGRVVDPDRPSAKLDLSSSEDGRSGRVVDPARPSAELDWSSSAINRAGQCALSVVSGLLVLLRVECGKNGATPYEGCLRTLVEGIKPFVVRLDRLSGMLLPMAFYMGEEGTLRVVIS